MPEQSLEYLISKAREYRDQYGFSEKERERQVRSFAYGNTLFENPNISRSDIDKAMSTLQEAVEKPVCS